MKTLKIISLSLVTLSCFTTFAQSTATSASKYFNIQKVVLPPDLKIIENSVSFQDADGNNVINANEVATISFRVQNIGRGGAYGCTARINADGAITGLHYKNQDLKPIPVGEDQMVVFPIQATEFTTTGTATFTIAVDEPNGFGTDPVQLTVKTHKFDSPMVEIVSYKIMGDGDTQLHKKKMFKLQVLVQNTDQGDAKNVSITLNVPNNMFNLNDNQTVLIPLLKPNQQELIEYELQTNANIPNDINLSFNLSESYGRFAKNSEIPLHFGQPISAGMVALNIQGQDRKEVEIAIGSLISDVDTNIPLTKKKNDNTFVVIVANENYQQVASVPFAHNDGAIFREYCIKTLGIPEKNIKLINDATSLQLKSQVTWLQSVTDLFEDERVIFYYAGHGIPDEKTQSSYLLPVDGIGTDATTGYSIDNLYAALGNMDANNITIFMDACFSGSKRGSGMLAQARGVALKAKSGVPMGNMVVFSAAQGDETAYPNPNEGHGMFTYYLLKKLQETQGEVTLKELGEYIITNVSRQSIVLNSKSQTPCVTPSSNVADSWQSWKLR